MFAKQLYFEKSRLLFPIVTSIDWVPNFEPCFRSLLSFLASNGRLRAVRRCGRHTEKERFRFVATETRRHSAVSHTSVERSVTKLRLSRSHLCSLTRLSQNHTFYHWSSRNGSADPAEVVASRQQRSSAAEPSYNFLCPEVIKFVKIWAILQQYVNFFVLLYRHNF